jgi:hypothetical protein
MSQMERVLANMPPEHQAAAHEAMQVLDHHLNQTDEWMGQVQKYGQWLESVCSDPKFVAAMEHVTGQKYGGMPGTPPDAQPAGQPAPPALAALPEGTTFETDTEKLLYEQAEASRKVIEQQQTALGDMGKVVEELRAHQQKQTQQGYQEMQGHFASVVNKLETDFKQHYPGIFQNEQSVTAWRRQATIQLMTILDGQNVKPTEAQIAEAMTQAARILNYPEAQQQGAKRGARAQRQAAASATSRGGGRAPQASMEPATTLAETAAQMAAGRP